MHDEAGRAQVAVRSVGANSLTDCGVGRVVYMGIVERGYFRTPFGRSANVAGYLFDWRLYNHGDLAEAT